MDTNEEHAANLKNYEIQLQQVMVALASDPKDEELLKLKTDLEEVIELTKELMGPLDSGPSHAQEASQSTFHSFKAGEKVLAPWSVDGLYYEARVDDVTSDGQCTVFFSSSVLPESASQLTRSNKKGVTEVCLTSLLKPQSKKNRWDQPSSSTSVFKDSAKHSKQQLSREALKKKRDKRQSKLKELEEEREKDKMKWQSFAMKKSGSKKKGLTNTATGSKNRVSIFASPDTVDGRVGVGTCGISGRPMTAYTNTAALGSSALSVPHTKKTLTSGFPSSS